jgi:hypothetical protein
MTTKMTLIDCIEFLKDEMNLCNEDQDQYYIDSYAECISLLESIRKLT